MRGPFCLPPPTHHFVRHAPRRRRSASASQRGRAAAALRPSRPGFYLSIMVPKLIPGKKKCPKLGELARHRRAFALPFRFIHCALTHSGGRGSQKYTHGLWSFGRYTRGRSGQPVCERTSSWPGSIGPFMFTQPTCRVIARALVFR